MITHIISALLQLVLFSLIPFLVFLFRKNKDQNFFEYIGLYRANRKAIVLAFGVAILIGGPVLLLGYFNADFHAIMVSPTSMMGKFKAMGFGLSAMLLIVIDAGIKTSLSEEIFFRGFVAKRLLSVLNFHTANIIQAIVFGAIHTLLFMTITDNYLFLAFIFIFPSIGAYLKVYLNEKVANGSIIPGWIAHGLGNLIAYTAGAFVF